MNTCVRESVSVCTCVSVPLSGSTASHLCDILTISPGHCPAIGIFSKPTVQTNALVSALRRKSVESEGSRVILSRHSFSFVSPGATLSEVVITH